MLLTAQGTPRKLLGNPKDSLLTLQINNNNDLFSNFKANVAHLLIAQGPSINLWMKLQNPLNPLYLNDSKKR